MDDRSKQEMIKFYSDLLDIHGPKMEALGEGFKDDQQQQQKFFLSSQASLMAADASILDVGCGLGYLCDYYRKRGWKGKYTGIDLNHRMVEAAKDRLPNEEFLCADILQDNTLKHHDYTFCISTIQHKPTYCDPISYLKEMIAAMFNLTDKALIFDVFTAKVEFKAEGHLYVEPAQLLEYCYSLTKRLTLRNDYRPYQYMLYLYKNTLKNEQNVFIDWENTRGSIV